MISVQKHFVPSWRRRLATFAFIFIAVLIWRYFHLFDFGLYEDDFTRIPRAMSMSYGELWNTILRLFRILGGQGRPFHDVLIYLFAGTIGRWFGLWSLYLLGAFFFSVNIALLYELLMKVSSKSLAIIACLAFLLFPADTTQIYLTHSLGVQPALTAILLAYHLSLRGQHAWAYLAAFFSLFCYETIFLLFLAAPLMVRGIKRNSIRPFLRHLVIILALLVSAVLLRLWIGESRALSIDFQTIITTPFLHMVQGPFVSMGAYFLRPYQVLTGGRWDLVLIAIGSVFILAGLSWYFLRDLCRRKPAVLQDHDGGTFNLGGIRIKLSSVQWHYFQYMLIGSFLLLVAYPLTFTVRAYAITGRDTRVHLAAAFGAAILFASVVCFSLTVVRRSAFRYVTSSIVVLVLAMNGSFAYKIQLDYQRSWEEQQEFWSYLTRSCSDVDEGTILLLEPAASDEKRQISSNSWNLPRILEQLFQFPDSWQDLPRVYLLADSWYESILDSNGDFVLSGTTTLAPPSLYRTVDPGNVILLRDSGDSYERIFVVEIHGEEVGLKVRGEDNLREMQRQPLYEALIGDV